MADTLTPELEAMLWPNRASQSVWSILDGARDRRVWNTLHVSSMRHTCLYRGPMAGGLEQVAPHLVQLDYRQRDSEDLIRAAWGNSWGIFFRCQSTLDVLRRHFWQFLSVQDASGCPLLFRYYDPRVLRVYLPTCRSNELRTVFGPVDCFCVEDEDPNGAIEFRFDGLGLVRKPIALAAPPP
jgi:hypothetical protein